MEQLYPYIATIGVNGKHSPSFAMNDSKTRRIPHKGIDSYRKNKLLFGILLTLQCCSRWIHRDRKATRESFTKTQMEKLWFYYVLSRSTLPRGLILSDFWEYIDCFLLASSLLLKRIVDSFALHRRFFCLESTLLLESTDDSFGKHREYLGQSINFISQRSLFLISTDSFSLHQLKL